MQLLNSLLFGSHNLSTLTSEINSGSGCYKTKNSEYRTYNKVCVENDLSHKGCLMYRLDKIERGQMKVNDFSQEIEKTIENIDKKINSSFSEDQKLSK